MAYQLLIFVMNLNCTYINLDSAKERKKRFEKQIRHLPFTFNRDSAKTVDDVRKENLNGKLHDRGKAIFLSHLEAINNVKQDKNSWICEDDSIISRSCYKNISKLNNFSDWDIIFTDVCFGDPSQILNLFNLNRFLKRKSETTILSLKNYFFSSLNSYIINSKSKRKIIEMINSKMHKIDENLDIIIARFIREGHIKGYCFMPFLTSVNDFADKDGTHCSSIQYLLNMSRKLFFCENDLLKEDDFSQLDKYFPENDLDEQSKNMLNIQKAFLHPKLLSRLIK